MKWQEAFTKSQPAWKDSWTLTKPVTISTLPELKHFLDLVQIKHSLIRPFCEHPDYPLVETRELLPSFECDFWEYKNLPSVSLVAFARPIQSFNEIFQFDRLHPVPHSMRADHAQATIQRNLNTLLSRTAKSMQEHLRDRFTKEDITDLNTYSQLMPFLGVLDRAQVFALHGDTPQDRQFYLAGVYGSFPSDLDTEIKRFGLRIGKFSFDQPELYEENRAFVCQFLMELYGFPFSSERRTSAALFARRLHKMGEHFLIRTLSQSDRTITTIWNNGGNLPYPKVEKIALVSVDDDYEQLNLLREKGFLVDEKQRIVILRVHYRQHKFSTDNVQEERALSLAGQELIHPVTGEVLPVPNGSIIRDSRNMVLRLNDIARGEYTSRTLYKRAEYIDDTATHEKRLKVLYAVFSKHQRRLIGYSDDFFAGIDKILGAYLYPINPEENFADLKSLYDEVTERYDYIRQARQIHLLEGLAARNVRGEQISYSQMLTGAVELLHSLKFEIVRYFDSLVQTALSIGHSILNDRYLIQTYIEKTDDALTPRGVEIKKNYRKLISVIDELQAIRKSKLDIAPRIQG